jgi:hypothetical protein
MKQAILIEISWFHSVIPEEYWVQVERYSSPFASIIKHHAMKTYGGVEV